MSFSREWNRLPKFLLVDQSRCLENDHVWVLHCHEPRFLLEFGPPGAGDVLLIDECSDFETLSALREQARKFTLAEYKRADRLKKRTLRIDFRVAESKNHKTPSHDGIAEITCESDYIFVARNDPLDLLLNLLCSLVFILKLISFLAPKLKKFPINH